MGLAVAVVVEALARPEHIQDAAQVCGGGLDPTVECQCSADTNDCFCVREITIPMSLDVVEISISCNAQPTAGCCEHTQNGTFICYDFAFNASVNTMCAGTVSPGYVTDCRLVPTCNETASFIYDSNGALRLSTMGAPALL